MAGCSRRGKDDGIGGVRVLRFRDRAGSGAGTEHRAGEVEGLEKQVPATASDEIALANQ